MVSDLLLEKMQQPVEARTSYHTGWLIERSNQRSVSKLRIQFVEHEWLQWSWWCRHSLISDINYHQITANHPESELMGQMIHLKWTDATLWTSKLEAEKRLDEFPYDSLEHAWTDARVCQEVLGNWLRRIPFEDFEESLFKRRLATESPQWHICTPNSFNVPLICTTNDNKSHSVTGCKM